MVYAVVDMLHGTICFLVLTHEIRLPYKKGMRIVSSHHEYSFYRDDKAGKSACLTPEMRQ